MTSSSPGRAWPVHPLLFAAYAVLFLFAENVAEVGLRDVLPPLGRSVLGAALALVLAGLVFRDMRRGALVATAGVAAFFAYGHVAELLDPLGIDRDAQLVGWALLLVVAVVLAVVLDARRVATLTGALDALALVLVALALVQVVPHEAQALASSNQPLGDRPAPQAGDRDIYFLVFDRYGSQASLRAYTDARSDLPDWLEEHGFDVARDAQANYVRTSLSLASTLQMTYLDDIAARAGPDDPDLGPVNQVFQDHAVGRFLRERGYRLIHLGSWFTPTSTSRIADENPQAGTETDFEVLLRDTTMLPLADELIDQPTIGHDDAQHRDTALFQLRMLERLRDEPGPKFVFAHILLPHPPYVFLPDGSYPSEEQRDRPVAEQFRDQLAYTDRRIRELVEQLLDAPEDRRPIIVIAADEGPYPARYEASPKTFRWATATDEEIRIKYGILGAFYFPEDGTPAPSESISPVNTFRLLFSRIFGADLPLLEDRSYTSDYERPYDFTDVTDILAGPPASP